MVVIIRKSYRNLQVLAYQANMERRGGTYAAGTKKDTNKSRRDGDGDSRMLSLNMAFEVVVPGKSL